MPLDLSGKVLNSRRNSDEEQTLSPANNLIRPGENLSWNTVSPKYTLDDLILEQQNREMILDVIAFYQYRQIVLHEWGLYRRYHDRMNLSINLYGESGTGKTMAAHAIAEALHKQILFVDYAEIESKFVGETAKNIKQLFLTANELDAVIIFDEADALLSKRVTDMRSSTDVSVNQTRSVLLNILNEYQGIVVFTTNFIQNFDPAFIRRIRYQIKFNIPNAELRRKLWEMYVPREMPNELDFAKIASEYEGISGSDIANAVLSAAIRAARSRKEIVQYSDFSYAINQIIQAKTENTGSTETVTKRVVSEEYVKEQLNKKEL